MGCALRSARISIRWRVEILAFSRELLHQAFELRHATFRRADGHTVLATRIAAGLARVQPILQGAGQQAVRNVPEVGILVLIGQPIPEVDSFCKSRVESVSDLGHGPLIFMTAL